jgi:bacillithiol synthase
MRTLRVRAWVEGRPEPPFDRLFDPLTHDLVSSGPLARSRFATRWSDRDALAALAGAKRAPLPEALAVELRALHQRLGASALSLIALERLARGEAVCAIAGQQPSPLGGPLYALHKTAAAVGLARRIEARIGVPCVPVFWTHVEDSDFAEVRTVTLADDQLALHELTLGEELHREGGLVGAIPAEPVRALGAEAVKRWSRHPARDEVAALAGLRPPLDLGELHSAQVLALFADQGVVVVDPRLPAFRAAARPVIERYLERAEACAEAARRAGQELGRTLGRAPLTDPALESFVFAIEDGMRRKLTVAEARARPGPAVLGPSVALRPVVQDAVLPTVAMACGPGELAYLGQLREVFDRLEVRPACPAPRLGATWLPPPAVELIEAATTEGLEPWEVVAGTDRVLRRMADARVPPELRAELERVRGATAAGLERFAALSTRLDPSLPQLVESARVKVDWQFGRLLEGLAGKARHRLEREHPEWLRLRYYLAPGDKLQERRLASLEPVAWRGIAVAGELCELAEDHAESLERGMHPHALVEL